MARDVVYAGKSQKIIDAWPEDVTEIINTNLQGLQESQVHSFSDLPDWPHHGKLCDKTLQGGNLKGARQLTIKHKDSYRVVYIAEFKDIIVVLHSFKKQKEGKQGKDMDTVEQRLKDAKSAFSTKT